MESTEDTVHLTNCKDDAEAWEKIENSVLSKVQKAVGADLKTESWQNKLKKILFSEPGRRTELLQGIVKEQTKQELWEIGISRRKTKAALETLLEEWLNKFQEEIWQPRCKKIIQWEKENGITKRLKHSPGSMDKGNRKKNSVGSTTLERTNKINKKQSWTLAKDIAFKEYTKWIQEGFHENWNDT